MCAHTRNDRNASRSASRQNSLPEGDLVRWCVASDGVSHLLAAEHRPTYQHGRMHGGKASRPGWQGLDVAWRGSAQTCPAMPCRAVLCGAMSCRVGSSWSGVRRAVAWLCAAWRGLASGTVWHGLRCGIAHWLIKHKAQPCITTLPHQRWLEAAPESRDAFVRSNPVHPLHQTSVLWRSGRCAHTLGLQLQSDLEHRKGEVELV